MALATPVPAEETATPGEEYVAGSSLPSAEAELLVPVIQAFLRRHPGDDASLIVRAAETATVAHAGQLRRSAVDVRWQRRTLGLKPFADGCEKPWVEFELRLLGTATDQKIAHRLGRTLQTVRYKRRRLKIPAVVEQSWTKAELALLGTMRDEKLARKIGRSVNAVHTQRNNRGIPCFKSKLNLWRPEDDKILGTRPDGQIAALLGRSTYAVATRRRDKGIPIFQSGAKRR